MALIGAVVFDFGHTLVDEQRDASIPLESRAVHLMPEVSETLPRIPAPMAVPETRRMPPMRRFSLIMAFFQL